MSGPSPLERVRGPRSLWRGAGRAGVLGIAGRVRAGRAGSANRAGSTDRQGSLAVPPRGLL